MPYPYTPAQLAAFRTAMALLAEGIVQGEKALSDERYIRLMEAAAPADRTTVTTATESPKTPEIFTEQTSEPKEGFTFLSWFKKKKTDAPATATLTRAESFKKSANVTPPTRKIPETFYFESSDTRIVSRFLADLPWSGKPQDAVTLPVGTSPATLTNDHADNRNVSQFFSGLPWVSGGKSAAVPVSVAVDNFVAPIKESFDIAGQSTTLTADAPSRDQLAKTFFSGLPWQVADQKNKIAVETTFEQSQALPEKTITINRKAFKPVEDAATDQNTAPSVKAYFSSLPWSQKSGHNYTGQSQLIPRLEQVPSGKEKVLGDYLQNLPWDGSQPDSKSASSKLDLTSTKEGQGIFALATQSALQASKKGQKSKSQPLQKNMAKFFSDLPWSGSR